MNRKILFIFLLALAARLVYFGFFPDRPITVDDALSWDAVAINLAQGKGFKDSEGFPTAVRPPAYPLFLAANYLLFGHEYVPVKLVQILLSALTCVLVFLIAKKLRMEIPAFWAGIFSALYPPLIVYSTIIGSETLFIFLLSVTLYFFTRAVTEFSLKDYALAGIILGVMNLCRSTLSFFPFFLFAIFVVLKRPKNELKWLFLSTVITFLVMAPWTVRNYRAYGHFLLVNVSAGQLFWLGSIEETGGRYVKSDYPGYRQFDGIENPVEVERAHFQAGIRNIVRNPVGFAKLTVIKFFRLWFKPIGYNLISERSQFLASLLLAAHCGLLLLFLYGGFRSFPDWQVFLPLYTLFIYFAIMHNIIAPMPRFRLPLEPFLLLFAALGLDDIKARIGLKK